MHLARSGSSFAATMVIFRSVRPPMGSILTFFIPHFVRTNQSEGFVYLLPAVQRIGTTGYGLITFASSGIDEETNRTLHAEPPVARFLDPCHCPPPSDSQRPGTRLTMEKAQTMQGDYRILRRCGAILAIALLSHLTVHCVYAAVGNWPPYWTAVVASYLLASAVWLLVLFLARLSLLATIGKYPIKRVLTLMTIVAILCGGTRLMGFYPSLLTYLVGLTLASLVNLKSNPLYTFRRDCLRRAPRLLYWLPGSLMGVGIFSALHVYDLQVRMLNNGRFEFSLSLCVLVVFCANLGAFCQLLAINGSNLFARTGS